MTCRLRLGARPFLSLVLWQVGAYIRPMHGYSGRLYTLLFFFSTAYILWAPCHLCWHITRGVWPLAGSLIPGITLESVLQHSVGAFTTSAILASKIQMSTSSAVCPRPPSYRTSPELIPAGAVCFDKQDFHQLDCISLFSFGRSLAELCR